VLLLFFAPDELLLKKRWLFLARKGASLRLRDTSGYSAADFISAPRKDFLHYRGSETLRQGRNDVDGGFSFCSELTARGRVWQIGRTPNAFNGHKDRMPIRACRIPSPKPVLRCSNPLRVGFDTRFAKEL